MWAALLLGLTGSLGHCVGMCSGVALMLGRRGQAQGWRVALLHLGRVTTYMLLGAVAGGIGFSILAVISYCAASLGIGGQANIAGPPGTSSMAGWLQLQGTLALFTAVLTIYMALALIGWLPSPELFLTGITRRWGGLMRRLNSSAPAETANPPRKSNVFSLFAMGMLWGLLPCGLVMTGLVAAAVAGSPQRGAITMLAFGVGTLPVNAGFSLLARLKNTDVRRLARPGFRYAGAVIVLIFGLQMALRGFAAWGWVDHYHMGAVMLW